MGFFNRTRENYEQARETERQRLTTLSEKELMIEIVLLLEDLSRKSDNIQRNQIIYSD